MSWIFFPFYSQGYQQSQIINLKKSFPRPWFTSGWTPRFTNIAYVCYIFLNTFLIHIVSNTLLIHFTDNGHIYKVAEYEENNERKSRVVAIWKPFGNEEKRIWSMTLFVSVTQKIINLAPLTPSLYHLCFWSSIFVLFTPLFMYVYWCIYAYIISLYATGKIV